MYKQYKLNDRGNAALIVLLVIVALVIGLTAGWTLKTGRVALQNEEISQPSMTSTAHDLNQAERKLWEDHVVWTRMYIVSALHDNGDSDEVLKRLLKNQEELGDAIKPYYGDEAGEKLTTLLKTHIEQAGTIVGAVKKNDTATLTATTKKWYENANEIADFLSSANPNWDQTEMRNMMKEHLDLTTKEVVDIKAGADSAAVEDYDMIHDQILKMADHLSDGIVKQFPEKFSK